MKRIWALLLVVFSLGWISMTAVAQTIKLVDAKDKKQVDVLVDGKPIRSRQSLEWCLKAVDQCWSQKKRFIRPMELEDAKQAYAHARTIYKSRLDEASRE